MFRTSPQLSSAFSTHAQQFLFPRRNPSLFISNFGLRTAWKTGVILRRSPRFVSTYFCYYCYYYCFILILVFHLTDSFLEINMFYCKNFRLFIDTPNIFGYVPCVDRMSNWQRVAKDEKRMDMALFDVLRDIWLESVIKNAVGLKYHFFVHYSTLNIHRFFYTSLYTT